MEVKCKKCNSLDDAYVLEVWSCFKCGNLDFEIIDDKEYVYDYSDCFI